MRPFPRIPALALVALVFISLGIPATADDAKALLVSAPLASDYPNSGFVNLIDESRYVIKSDGSWTEITRVVAKIFNERGRDLANVHLAYNSAFEKIEILRARTIKSDGTVINVDRDEIREVSPYAGYAMYSSVKAKVMIMPAIEDDCIIDYQYKISGKKTIMPPHFWMAWYFQSGEPTMLSRFTLEAPADRSFGSTSYVTKVDPKVTRSNDGKTATYVWEGRNYGEILPEPFMPPLSEICPWFELSSVGSWDDVAAWYWKLVERQLKPTPEIQAAVKGLTQGKETDADKARVIYYWVEDKIRYVGLEFGAGAYEPHSAKEVFNNRYGDCKDQATLLVTMLKAAGIKAYPVLVSTGFKGKTGERLPSPGIFDHAIAVAEIDGKYAWMDSTAEVCTFGDLPEADRGRELLIIKNGKGEFMETPEYTAGENSTSQTVKIKLNDKGGINASVAWEAEGSDELATRGTYKYAKPSSIKEGFEATVAAISPDATLTDYTVSDPTQRDEPVKVSYDFEADGWANRTTKFLIFRPSLYQAVLSSTPFSKPDRKFDVCFAGISMNSSETEITLPEGFNVEEIPANVSLKLDFATYNIVYTLEGNVLKISEKLVRQDARIPVDRYQEVRKFYQDVIQAQKQQVVMRTAS